MCTKAVYATERIQVETKVFHRNCFRCDHCKGAETSFELGFIIDRLFSGYLKLGSYASLDGKYFCKPHFKQLFGTPAFETSSSPL